MKSNFSRVLSLLRQEKGVSQRKAAADLGISQALLSHYENGTREPGLAFLVRACDYYGVTADYLLGRTQTKTTATGEEAAALARAQMETGLSPSAAAKEAAKATGLRKGDIYRMIAEEKGEEESL